MQVAVFFLGLLVLMLLIYIFLMKRELARVQKNIRQISDSDSNSLVHSEITIKELDRLIEEINDIIREARAAKSDYENKNEQLKKMITNISHDLRTPLTSALGYVDIMLSSVTDTEQKKDLEIIKERLERLKKLINSFFEFTKVELMRAALTLEPINIVGVLEESIARYFDDFNRENREILFTCHVKKHMLASNRDMLLRIFDNIIGNAYKHSDGNLEITVKNEEILKIVFTNKLICSNLDMNHIFDEFYTYDISRQKGNTGLGLAIVKQFVMRLGGACYAATENDDLNIVVEFK
ncbi:MAG: HAMP domain-containing histidine kinase [Muribaculaceae bacterium]|nr:HAMP domain-containing histidine kinase [Muribaculaceae bacterium]MCM1399855.1 HAMP domain-containing histidine kinase [Clostridium sp.]MCM1460660.1 HAMP domain-containing histidine kinase [Bacteroides sp.]